MIRPLRASGTGTAPPTVGTAQGRPKYDLLFLNTSHIFSPRSFNLLKLLNLFLHLLNLGDQSILFAEWWIPVAVAYYTSQLQCPSAFVAAVSAAVEPWQPTYFVCRVEDFFFCSCSIYRDASRISLLVWSAASNLIFLHVCASVCLYVYVS